MQPLRLALAALALATAMMAIPALAQIQTPCNASAIASFTPCMNFVTNSTGNGTASPTRQCCDALKGMTGSGLGCLCLIVAGGVPFQIPINRTLAISLPSACNMPGVPVQCQAAAGTPLPSPGPSFGPTLSPGVSPTTSPSPTGSSVPEPISPESDTPVLTPPSTADGSGAVTPTANTGSRPVLTPSGATSPSQSLSASVIIFAMGYVVMKF